MLSTHGFQLIMELQSLKTVKHICLIQYYVVTAAVYAKYYRYPIEALGKGPSIGSATNI